MTEEEWQRLQSKNPTALAEAERQWILATNPSRMLDIVRYAKERVPIRKLRLYIVACCRTLPPGFQAELKEELDACEQFAGSEMSLDQFNRFRSTVKARNHPLSSVDSHRLCRSLLCGNKQLWDMAKNTGNTVTTDIWRFSIVPANPAKSIAKLRSKHPRETLCDLLRCIFGNPLRFFSFEEAWLTSTVVALAAGIYDERAFDRMPILADALQDAGFDNDVVLNHCRQPGEHVRGCWVVDLVLSKC